MTIRFYASNQRSEITFSFVPMIRFRIGLAATYSSEYLGPLEFVSLSWPRPWSTYADGSWREHSTRIVKKRLPFGGQLTKIKTVSLSVNRPFTGRVVKPYKIAYINNLDKYYPKNAPGRN